MSSQSTRAAKTKQRVSSENPSSSPSTGTLSSLPTKQNKAKLKNAATNPSQINKVDDSGISWIQCDLCKKWDIMDNSGICNNLTSSQLSQIDFQCHYCTLVRRLEEAIARIEDAEKRLLTTEKLNNSL